MRPKVFVSYSSKEFEIAEGIRSRIEEAGVATWMAPASIEGGTSYAEQIPRAIRTCDLFVLVLSRKAMASIWVSREVDRALNEGKRILPFVIENAPLTDEYNFYLTNVQRYPAYRDFEGELERMIGDIRLFLGIPAPAPAAEPQPEVFTVPTEPAPAPAEPAPAKSKPEKAPKPKKVPKPEPVSTPETAPGSKRKKKLPLILALAAVLIAGGLLAVFLLPGRLASRASVTLCGKPVNKNSSYISLSGTVLTAEDLVVIGSMPKLSTVNIQDCQVTAINLSSLVGPGVTSLRMTDCSLTAEQLESLPLAGSRVSTLDLSGNDVADLGLFAGAENLRSLTLNGCGITDLEPLRGNEQLNSLYLNNNDVADLTPLSRCKGLRYLSLTGNGKVADLSPLGGCQKLTELYLSGTAVKDLSPLAECTDLTKLSVGGTGLESLHGLEKAIRLKCLDAADNRLTSLEGLENTTVLAVVDLSRNRLTDVDLLAKSAQTLSALLLQGNQLTAFVPADSFPELERLNVADNDLSSLGQASFPKLKHLCVSGNANLTRLPELGPQLHCLYAAGCRLSEVGNCFVSDTFPGVLDLRDTPVEALTLAEGRYAEIILTGVELKGDMLTALASSKSFELYLDYREGLPYESLKEASYRIYLVGCPLDQQLTIQSLLRTVIFLDTVKDAEETIDPLERVLSIP